MNTDLAPIRPLTPGSWQMIQSVGASAHMARRFGFSTPEEAAIKMMVAHEFGMPLSTALSSVYIIDSKPVLAPKLLWARVQAHPSFAGYEETRLEKDGMFEGWKITLKRQNMPAITREFTMTQARSIEVKTGQMLADKSNWKNYPEDVCYWRALDRAMHVAYADVCMGLYAADELGADIGPEGEVLEGQWTVVTEEPKAPSLNAALKQLTDHWTPAEIFEANEGAMPTTLEEVEACKAALEGLGGEPNPSAVDAES